jgi:N4-gp56 family major capsid protein
MTTTTNILPPPVQQQFSEKMLSTPMARLVHNLFAVPRTMEGDNGKTLRMRRYNRIQTAPSPVDPLFLNPPAQRLTEIDIDATVNWYSTYIVLTREVTAINQDPVLNQAAARLGQSLRETEDELMKNLLESTAASINCVGGTNGDNPTNPTANDFDQVVAALQYANADFVSNIIEGEDRLGTGPVGEAYFCMASNLLIPSLQNMTDFIRRQEYPKVQNLLSAEWGSLGNVRFVLSSFGSITPNASLLGADVYNMFITGQEAYTSIELAGENAKFIYHPAGHGDDPCELRKTAAYRFAHARAITNDAWLTNLRCTI